MQRVSVVGTSGAGKSTVAAALAALLGASFLELDSVHHQAPLPRSEFRALVAAAAAGERWVIDGNYSSVQDIVWARADTVVWLDLPRRTVMRRVIWRTLRRIGGRVELWNGNVEPPLWTLLMFDGFIRNVLEGSPPVVRERAAV